MTIDRVVIDTNVLISAILSKTGSPALLLDELRARRTTLIFSDKTYGELNDRLLRPKFDRYVSRGLRQIFLAQVDAISEYVSITSRPMGCRDRDDDKFIETALLGDADLLVTGDSDLLDMTPFDEFDVCRPADALSRIHAQTL